MKPSVLRAPLIKSAIVLVIFSLLVYFTGSSAEGSVWSAIGTIFITAFKTIQWLIGLSIALVVCIAVMIGIFFGAVAMINPSSSSRMYEGLRLTLIDWFQPLVNALKSNHAEQLTSALDEFGGDLKKEINADIAATQNILKKNQAELENKLSSLSSRLTALEETTSGLAAAEQVDALGEEVKGAVDSAAEIKTALKGELDALKNTAEQTAKQIQEVSGEAILGELPARIEALEQQEIPEPPPAVDIAPLQKDITALQAELTAVQQKVEEALQAATKVAEKPAVPASTSKNEPAEKESKKEKKSGEAEIEEHRIFSYFDDPADKKKVTDLVASTLKKDMSYKQVMDYVAKELGGAKGEIITSHPSLSKDYIRQCRRSS